jgi:hypothetical protein
VNIKYVSESESETKMNMILNKDTNKYSWRGIPTFYLRVEQRANRTTEIDHNHIDNHIHDYNYGLDYDYHCAGYLIYPRNTDNPLYSSANVRQQEIRASIGTSINLPLEHASMNGTPRLRSAYPATPATAQRTTARSSPQNPPKSASPLPTIPNVKANVVSNSALISEDLVPFPTQRLYASGIYGALLVWCLYDWWKLLEDDSASLGLFIKWICIFAIYLYGLPQLRIPWLEWSTNMSTLAFVGHAWLVGMLMFRIPVSLAFPHVRDFG